MSINCEPAEAPRLSAGERALLAALVEFPETTAAGVARVAQLSVATTRRALRRFETLGAAVRCSPPSIGGSSVPDLWSAAPGGLNLLAVPKSDAVSGSRTPTTRDKILTTVGLRPGLSLGELAWSTALSRRNVSEMLGVLEREGLVHRVVRRGRSGGRVADGWALAQTELDVPLFDLAADEDAS